MSQYGSFFLHLPLHPDPKLRKTKEQKEAMCGSEPCKNHMLTLNHPCSMQVKSNEIMFLRIVLFKSYTYIPEVRLYEET